VVLCSLRWLVDVGSPLRDSMMRSLKLEGGCEVKLPSFGRANRPLSLAGSAFRLYILKSTADVLTWKAKGRSLNSGNTPLS
jgi:hypothetical protein